MDTLGYKPKFQKQANAATVESSESPSPGKSKEFSMTSLNADQCTSLLPYDPLQLEKSIQHPLRQVCVPMITIVFYPPIQHLLLGL